MDDFAHIVDELNAAQTESDALGKRKGRNSKSTVSAYGFTFDSKEELDVYEWLVEAKSLGFVREFEYQPKSFILFDGQKNAKGKYDRELMPHVYTADFRIEFTDKWIDFRKANKIKMFDKYDERTVYVDIKGAWSIYDDGRSFVLNKKWVFQKYGVLIWKIVPLKFFERTWLPKNCVLTRKTKKVSAKYKNLRIFENKGFALNP